MIIILTISLKLIESTSIIYFLFVVLSINKKLTYNQVLYEIIITGISYIFSDQKTLLFLLLLSSFSLLFICVPHQKNNLLSMLYIIKFFYLQKNIGQLARLNLWKKFYFLKYGKFLFNFLRYSILEYLFLGFLIAGYKVLSLYYQQKLPPDFKLYYLMITTASTIGYGDICPQTRNQIIYFIFTIPIICGSFIIYFNHLSEIYNQTFISNNKLSTQFSNNTLQTPSQNIKSFINNFLLLQPLLICYYIFKIFDYDKVKLSITQILTQIFATIIFFIIQGRKSRIILNLIASSSLLVIGPIQSLSSYKFIIIFYFLKFFHAQQCLSKFAKNISTFKQMQYFKYINFFYNYIRYSILQYIFIALGIMGFKIYSHKHQLIPKYKLFYQWLDTTSSIGNGDPNDIKTDNQVIFITIIIPVMCYSFLVYMNHLNSAFNYAFLQQNGVMKDKKKALDNQKIIN